MWLLCAAAWATPDASALAASWERWRPQLDQSARYPFRFDQGEWGEVARGEVAKRRERLEGTDRVLAVTWIDANLDTTWLSIQDPHDVSVEGIVYEVLPGSTTDRRFAYQRISLPWPFTSRQWVIEIVNNLPLQQATGGLVWERSWTLSDRRDAKNVAESAVWLPVNEGGWYLVESGGGTLLLYHVRTAVGGVVPEEAALRWAFSTLDKLLTRIEERTTWIRTHYKGDHEPIFRPGGAPVPVFP
jgi:hypothetical protein